MNDTIERVARAIQAVRGPRQNWNRVTEATRDLWRVDAHAAIGEHTAALAEAGFVIVPREPTEAMVDAAARLTGVSPGIANAVWRAMNAAALGPAQDKTARKETG